MESNQGGDANFYTSERSINVFTMPVPSPHTSENFVAPKYNGAISKDFSS